jgi:hypothetical protein
LLTHLCIYLGVNRNRFAGVVLISLLVVSGCSGSHSIERRDLKSEVRNLQSVAEEVELYLSLVDAGAISSAFEHNHPRYLQEQLEDAREQLEGKSPDFEVADQYQLCRAYLAALTVETRHLDSMTTRPNRKHLQRIRKNLAELLSNL